MGVRAWFAAPESPFQPPGVAYQLLRAPLQVVVSLLHRALVALRGAAPPPDAPSIRVVCISDTHTHTPDLPAGDLLVHAGDLTNAGSVSELQAQLDWLDAQLGRFTHVVAIAGNHDSFFDPRSRRAADRGRALDFKRVRYLQHARTTLAFPARGGRRLALFGAPQIPACGGAEMAFQYAPADDAWSGTVPADVDVLVTHTPPRGHRDLGAGLGCAFLLGELWRVRPRLHVFGHVHAGRGAERVCWDAAERAHERLAARAGWWALLWPSTWLDVVRVLVYDSIGIVWTRVWGAEAEGTLMVNSSMVDYYGKPVFNAQVVEV